MKFARLLCLGVSLHSVAAFSQAIPNPTQPKNPANKYYVDLQISSVVPRSYSLINPNVPTCAAANCPNPANANNAPEILASTWVESIASSTVPRQQEWGSVFGMYSNVGQSSNYPTIPPSEKVTVYAGMVQGPLSGPAWTWNTDIVRNGCPTTGSGTVQPYIGSAQPCGTPMQTGIGVGTIGYELDFTNWDANQDIGGAEVVGMVVVGNSKYYGLAGYYMANHLQGPATASWAYGMLATNATAVHADYAEIDNVSTNGFSAGGNHASNGFVSTGTDGIDAFKDNGNATNASFESAGSTGATPNYAFVASGNYQVAVLDAVGATSSTASHLKVVRAPPLGDICLNGGNDCFFYSNTSALVNLTGANGANNFQFWDTGDFYVLNGKSYLSGGAQVKGGALTVQAGASVAGGLMTDTMVATGVAYSQALETGAPVVPTAGQTVTMTACDTLVLEPAATLATLTVVLPTTHPAMCPVTIVTSQTITALNISASSGIFGAITSMTANSAWEAKFIPGGSYWQRTNKPA